MDPVIDPSLPIPAAPPAPVIPVAAPAPVIPVPTTEHNHEDRMANRLATAMAAKLVNPTPGQPAPIVATPVPARVPPPSSTPAAALETPAVAPESAAHSEVDLSDLDFDAPTSEVAPTDTPSEERLSDTQISLSLQEMLDKGEVPEKIEEAFLKHSRGKRMLAAMKTERELAKPFEEGGIGRVPTIEEIRSGELARQDLTAMVHEAQTNPLSFINNLFTLRPDGTSPLVGNQQSVQAALSTIPDVLIQAIKEAPNAQLRDAHAALYTAYSTPVFQKFFDHQYSRLRAMPESNDQDKDIKGRVLDGLQIMEYTAFGKARDHAPYVGGAPVSPAPTSNDPEKQVLLDQLQRYRQNEQQQRQNEQQRINTTIGNTSRESAMKDITKVMDHYGLKNAYSDVILAPLCNELYTEIVKLLPRQDPGGWQNYEIQVREASLGRLDPAEPAKLFNRLFRNTLRNSPQVKQRFSSLVSEGMSRSNASHAALSQSQIRVEAGAAAAPAPSSVIPAVQMSRQPGETKEEFFTRRIAGVMTPTVPARR